MSHRSSRSSRNSQSSGGSAGSQRPSHRSAGSTQADNGPWAQVREQAIPGGAASTPSVDSRESRAAVMNGVTYYQGHASTIAPLPYSGQVGTPSSGYSTGQPISQGRSPLSWSGHVTPGPSGQQSSMSAYASSYHTLQAPGYAPPSGDSGRISGTIYPGGASSSRAASSRPTWAQLPPNVQTKLYKPVGPDDPKFGLAYQQEAMRDPIAVHREELRRRLTPEQRRQQAQRMQDALDRDQRTRGVNEEGRRM